MTPKERAAMQQALEFLESGDFVYPTKLATALREALAEQAEQEPVGHVLPDGTICWDRWCPDAGTLLYTHPVRTKDLTDDEIEKAVENITFDENFDINIARAVIAAYKEKQK